MKMIFIYISFFLSIAFISCEMMEDDSIPVYAGKYDSTFFYYYYSPPLELNFSWDNQHKFAFCDTIFDLDSDLEHDILIEALIFDRENVVFEDFIGRVYPYYKLTLYNGLEVSIYEEFYGLGHGELGTWNYIDTLCIGKRIDQLSKWSNSCSLWQANPGIFAPSEGGWFHARSTKFIGLKNNDRFGWIEVDATDPLFLKINSYAIQK